MDDILSECHGYGDESFERSFTLYKPGTRKPVTHQARGQVSFFFTLVTGPRRSLSLKLSDTRVYGPQIPYPLSSEYGTYKTVKAKMYIFTVSTVERIWHI